MGDAVEVAKMGATGNISNNAARLAILQERKRVIEETLQQRMQQLKELCLKEADITGVLPAEMPLDPGETLPSIRRRIGTAYQLPESLLKNTDKNEMIADLEIQLQLHAKLAEAANELAKEQNNRVVKKQRMQEYEFHMAKYRALKEKIKILKEKTEKQKKKPRSNSEHNDAVSININSSNDEMFKSEFRHSLRSYKNQTNHYPYESTASTSQHHSSTMLNRYSSRNGDESALGNVYDQQNVHEDLLNSSIYRLSLNGYNSYIERTENNNANFPPKMYPNYAYGSYLSPQQQQQQHQQMYKDYYYQQHRISSPPQIQSQSPNSPLIHQSMNYNLIRKQSLPNNFQLSPQLAPNNPGNNNNMSTMYYLPSDYNHSNNSRSGIISHSLPRQSSPIAVGAAAAVSNESKYSSYTIGHGYHYRSQQQLAGHLDNGSRNPLQLQPHQQYEQSGMATGGLGGYWKRSLNGELIWCNDDQQNLNATWQRDKRFGSLDRRKNRRTQKKMSPSVESNKINSVNYHRPVSMTKSSNPTSSVKQSHQDIRQLVRTQSLGSVGGHTLDSGSTCTYHNEEHHSSESDDDLSMRKQKEKDWMETSLDSPVSVTRSHSKVSVLAPEEKYHSPPIINSPSSSSIHSPSKALYSNAPPAPVNPPKVALVAQYSPVNEPSPVDVADSAPKIKEIPAESNPTSNTQRLPENLNIFTANNNTVPKNGTLVQAGHCKPYHEETKPFEMADFYKYSTKFNKSPVKSPGPANTVHVESDVYPNNNSGDNQSSTMNRNKNQLPTENKALILTAPSPYNDNSNNIKSNSATLV